MGVLTGIRVTDFCWAIAGSTSTELLAAFGAQVIKVESMRRPDPLRVQYDAVTSQRHGMNTNFLFNDVNRNKLSIRLNVGHPKGLELAKTLIGLSDVVTESMSAGVMERIGLGYDEVRRARPDIVMYSASTSGSYGPDAGALGYAPIFASLGGLSHMTGYPDGPPTEIRASMDIYNGYLGFLAIMAALVHRQRVGEGQFIDLAFREGVSTLIGDSFLDFTANCRLQERRANLDESMAPHGCYRCKGSDEWVSIAVNTEEEWRDLSQAMGNPQWATDERFATRISRWSFQGELDRLLETWTIDHTNYEVMESLQRAGVPAVASLTPQQLFVDPHLEQRNSWLVMKHREAGNRFSISFPWKLSQTPFEIHSDSPLFGEHTEYVFSEILGLTRDRLVQLQEEGVLY